jgi:hypothetical protein
MVRLRIVALRLTGGARGRNTNVFIGRSRDEIEISLTEEGIVRRATLGKWMHELRRVTDVTTRQHAAASPTPHKAQYREQIAPESRREAVADLALTPAAKSFRPS